MATDKGIKTRDRIVENSIHLFAKHGYHITSFQHVADRCKVHQPAIFYYFKTKDDLLREVISEVIRRSHVLVSQFTDAKVNGADWLIGHFIGTLYWVKHRQEEASVLLLLYYLATQEKMFEKDYAALQKVARGRILLILQHSKAQGLLKSDDNLELLASLLHDLLLGGLVNYLATGAQPEEELNLKKKWKSALNLFFKALPKKWPDC